MRQGTNSTGQGWGWGMYERPQCHDRGAAPRWLGFAPWPLSALLVPAAGNLPNWWQRLVCFYPVMSHSRYDWGNWGRAGAWELSLDVPFVWLAAQKPQSVIQDGAGDQCPAQVAEQRPYRCVWDPLPMGPLPLHQCFQHQYHLCFLCQLP